MGAKDRKANEYFADNRRFADMCNAVLFGGRTVILPEALEATDTTELLSVLGMDGKEISFQKWRDLLKRVIIKKNQNVYLVLNAGKGHGLCRVKLWGTGQGGWKTTQKGKEMGNKTRIFVRVSQE